MEERDERRVSYLCLCLWNSLLNGTLNRLYTIRKSRLLDFARSSSFMFRIYFLQIAKWLAVVMSTLRLLHKLWTTSKIRSSSKLFDQRFLILKSTKFTRIFLAKQKHFPFVLKQLSFAWRSSPFNKAIACNKHHETICEILMLILMVSWSISGAYNYCWFLTEICNSQVLVLVQ